MNPDGAHLGPIEALSVIHLAELWVTIEILLTRAVAGVPNPDLGRASVENVGMLISLWLFLFHLRVVCSTTKKFFFDRLKKLEQRSHKCVELRGEYVNIFFQSRSLLIFIKPKTYQPPRAQRETLAFTANFQWR
jgi:hypothetical protein